MDLQLWGRLRAKLTNLNHSILGIGLAIRGRNSLGRQRKRPSMNSLLTSSVVFATIIAGILFGIALRRVLPQDHLGQDAKDSVRLAIGLVVTMAALVLGMLVPSAKTYYDGQKSKIAQMSAEIILLNDSLTVFGPEAKTTRLEARHFVEDAADRIWPKEKSRAFELRPTNKGDAVTLQLQLLRPKNAEQVAAKAQIASLVEKLSQSYWLMFLESEQATIPMPLLDCRYIVGSYDLRKFWNFRSTESDSAGDYGDLRISGLGCSLPHYGNVHPLQRCVRNLSHCDSGCTRSNGSCSINLPQGTN